MIVYAAIDLRGGCVVQLEGGRPAAERIRLPDPVAVARRWAEAGFDALHVVDLDAALGAGTNRRELESILAAATLPVQVGGGIRDHATAHRLLDAGADRIVTGTRAIEDPAWLEELASARPGRVVVAADVRGPDVVTRGWTTRAGLRVETLLDRLAALPLAAVLITDVGREGRLAGADVPRFAGLAAATRHPVIAAGGIAGDRDLAALAAAGLAGTVVGMALYTGALDLRASDRETRR